MKSVIQSDRMHRWVICFCYFANHESCNEVSGENNGS